MIKMITSLKEEDTRYYKQFLEPSSKKFQLYLFQAVTRKGSPTEGIAKKYNLAIEAMFSNNMAEDNDIIVFINDDIGIVDALFKEKLELIFKEKPDIGVVGVLGSNQISNSIEYWMNPTQFLRGHILQAEENDVTRGNHLIKGPIGFYDNIMAVDKCMMAVRAGLLRDIRFDENIYKNEDLYNIDFCLQILERGYKISIADILIHQARQPINLSDDMNWKNERQKTIDKWNKYEFPINSNSFKDIEKMSIKRPEVMELEI